MPVPMCRKKVTQERNWAKEPMWTHMAHVSPYGSTWDHVGLDGPMWAHVSPYEPMWVHVGPCGLIWAIWIHMGAYGHSYGPTYGPLNKKTHRNKRITYTAVHITLYIYIYIERERDTHTTYIDLTD